MEEIDGLDALTADVEALEQSLGRTGAMTAAFDGQLRQIQGSLAETTAGLGSLDAGFSRGLRGAIDDVVLDGARLSDALRGLAQSMIDTAYSAAIKPVTDHVGGLLSDGVNALFGGAAFAQGGAFSQGRVMPFARGGVVDRATTFPMRGGTGLMGEAGPEAILPLRRGPDGSLGVAAGGGGAVNVTMQVHAADAQSFYRSQSQIAARMGRLLGQGQRNR